ncbi:MAG: endonuclease/exonuclease/phosphatase family protein [Gammaproteobacteria bacterium]
MPFYTWLKPKQSDSPRTLASKRRAAHKLKALKAALETHFAEAKCMLEGAQPPADSKQVVRIATWNIREFESNKYGRRLFESKAYMAEILSHFDLIAIQEVRQDLGPFKQVVRLLGPDWGFIATDVTEGSGGNSERMVFLFNRQKVYFNDVAGELTLPNGQKVTDPFGERFRLDDGVKLELPEGTNITTPDDLPHKEANGKTKLKKEQEVELPPGTKMELPAGAYLRFAPNSVVTLNDQGGVNLGEGRERHLPEHTEVVLPPKSVVGGPQQFSRTPFIASFQAGWLKLNLATVHIYYGKGETGLTRRKEEIRRLTKMLANRAKSDKDSDAESYFIALGDFNIVSRDHDTMDALNTNDFMVPEALQSLPGSNVDKSKWYDQIAVWMGESTRTANYTRVMAYRAGVFDFFETVFTEEERDEYAPLMRKTDSEELYSKSSYKNWRTFQMSDHLPMWVELHIDFSKEYLEDVERDLGAIIEGDG